MGISLSGKEAKLSEAEEAAASQAEPETAEIERDIHTEELYCELTPEDRVERGAKMAELVGDREQLEADKKRVTDQYATEIKGLILKESTLARQVRDGNELRDVDVERIRVENTSMIKFVRLDTGEEIRERQMTESERQERLFPEEPETDPAPDGPEAEGLETAREAEPGDQRQRRELLGEQ